MKKEYLILAVVIAALCAYLVLHRENKTNYTLPQVPVVKINDITEINIVKDKKAVTLKKKDGRWFIGDNKYPADKEKVKAMLNVIAKLSLSDLISQASDNTRYELDSAHGIKIAAKNESGSILRKFSIGKTAPTYRHTFITIDNNKNVYYARGNFRSDFDYDIDGFRDKTILSFNKDTITELKVKKGQNKKEFFLKVEKVAENKIPNDKLDKNAGKPEKDLKNKAVKAAPVKKWESKDNSYFNSSDIKDLISNFTNLKCSRYIYNVSKESYKSKIPLFVIQMKDKKNIDNNHSIMISIYPKNKNGDYQGICSENNYPFILGSYEGNDILSKVNALLGIKKTDKIKTGKHVKTTKK